MRRLLALAVLAGLLPALAVPPAEARAPARAKLSAFGSCAALQAYARRGARRTGGDTGVPTRAGASPVDVLVAPAVGGREGTTVPAPTAAAPQADTEAAAPGFSGTNVQEAGVDEPDLIKTDGRRIFAVANGRLHALAPGDGAPRRLGTLAVEGFGQQLLLRGERVLLIGSGPDGGVRLTEVDVADPAAMTVRRTLDLDGSFVDARLTGGTARVVVASSPEPLAPEAIAGTTTRSWVPRTTLRSRLSGRTFRRSVVPCDDVRRPREFSGLDLLSVLTVDLDRGLFSVDRDAVMAGAETVYASPTSLYVASRRWVAGDGEGAAGTRRTEIHAFDTSDPDRTTYRGSGAVAGSVLNQYSLSEHQGRLRVASTEDLTRESESFVTVLDARALTRLGGVGGLGRGERIYAVRFVGDAGYVVTFRQTDPLYALDLSDPADPRVRGELKILGYSAYLHPVSDDRLLGIGQDATAEGRTTGAQVSLFDVSDLRSPKRLAQADLGEYSTSSAEFDPRAFLFWRPTSLAVLPLEVYGQPERKAFAGAVGLRVGREALAPAGRIEHPTPAPQPTSEPYDLGPPPIGRSLVIGEHLFTLSYAGLGANRLDTLAQSAFTAFPAAPAALPPGSPAPRPAGGG